MTREDALVDLSNKHSERRLDAARTLSRVARVEDAPMLQAALARESTVWVKRALELALAFATSSQLPEPVGDGPGDAAVDHGGYLSGVKETTERLVHELRSALGLVSYWAGKELPEYGTSRTAQQIERLADNLRAIDELGRASTRGRTEEFVLGDLVSQEADNVHEELGGLLKFHLTGPAELLAHGDPSLLRLALTNVIRNAFEASLATGDPVILTWGASERDFWVVVLDRGGSLPSSVTRLFEFGVSTKTGHAGAGLTTVRQAVRAMNGSCSLSVTKDGSTRFEISWPIG